jgi:hypothetical protein
MGGTGGRRRRRRGGGGGRAHGWIDNGRLVLLKPADGGSVSQESW